MNLTLDEVRGLAELERDMDEGRCPFVVYRGARAALLPGELEHWGLKHGQTISLEIFIEMVKARVVQGNHDREVQEANDAQEVE